MQNDTIYALSTPPGNGVAVIRISGPETEQTLRTIFHTGTKQGWESHHLYYGKLCAAKENASVIDECMAVLMRAPRSYTAEDVGELHCHGSVAVLRQTLALLASLGLRQAEPGEFTRRAFENGRIDLSQAEAVMDLIHSGSQAQARQALSQMEGTLYRGVVRLQDGLTDAIAQLEAAIDYPEEDWEDEIIVSLTPALEKIKTEIRTLYDTGAEGKILREGVKVALIGMPNAGKSTLLNALLGEERAIVTDIPGTTRDTLEEAISIDGWPVRLIDTAGLRQSADPIEKMGVERSRKRMEEADLLLLLVDASELLSQENRHLLQEMKDSGHPFLLVLNKNDCGIGIEEADLAGVSFISVSAKTGAGLDDLQKALVTVFADLPGSMENGVLVGNRRQLDALAVALEALEAALLALQGEDMDCVSIDLRSAWHALGQISGNSIEEGIVDRIFEKFCLGK